ncbi:2-hydroxyacid dehydrogenase [Candidatus Latescibacterota bacterium]
MKIVVLEKIEMTKEQTECLEQLGDVKWYESSSEKESLERIKGADVVVVDWIDPSPFILSIKSPSLLALMSTGYGWIEHRDEARKQVILISNIPGYATEAVAEHLIGLALCVARQTMVGDRNIRAGKKEKGYLLGIELKGHRLGIIGLGQIGKRVAEIAKAICMEIVTYNRHPKSYIGIKDVPLDELLSTSDIVCVCCPLNDDSKGMLDRDRLNLMKTDAILVGATWNVAVLDELIPLLKNGHIRGAGFDAAIEGGKIDLPEDLLRIDNIVITPHIGYNTIEAKIRQVDICISNIEAFKKGKPINIVN